MSFTLYHGDCLEVLKTLPPNSVDSVVTDPPYGLSFMGKKWDYDVPAVEVWQECLRVLKPGGHLLAFAGTRTQHRMAVRIEDAGFEIRDMIAWVYGSGFPKSLDVSKAIDKAAGAEREVVGKSNRHVSGRPTQRTAGLNGSATFSESVGMGAFITAPATEAARQWQGWGTALKPALEPITLARKPLEGTVAENVLKWHTGAVNVDGCRVPTGKDDDIHTKNPNTRGGFGHAGASVYGNSAGAPMYDPSAGRWPANLIHDGSEEVTELFPETKSGKMKPTHTNAARAIYGQNACGGYTTMETYGDSGSADRFFYCAKASKKDRDEGLEGFELKESPKEAIGTPRLNDLRMEKEQARNPRANVHPTVKPTDLMRYLCRLVTRPGGTVLDPFTGSGSTGKAAMLEGFRFIGIEREAEYVAIADARIRAALESKPLI